MTESLQDAVKRFAAEVISKGYELQPVHPYEDSSGTIIYWRIRAKHPKTGEKWIRPMHLNGNGYELGEPKFVDGKPLYGLQLIAGNPDADVWITEGEQKADALNKLGLTAQPVRLLRIGHRSRVAPCVSGPITTNPAKVTLARSPKF